MRSRILSLVVFVSALPVAGAAQVPSVPQRPGLNLASSTSQPPQATRQGGYAQPGSYGGQPTPGPSANLVQRRVQAQPGTPPASSMSPANQSGNSDQFFYVQDGAQGPQDLTNGLSDYNSSRMSQAGQQLQGNYGDMDRSKALPAGGVQGAWNRPFDNMSSGQSSPGNIRYQWTSDLIMPVRLRAGMVTSIVLPDWEAAQDVVIGDGAAVEATLLRPNQVAVKSVQTGLDTSLSIVGGSGNVYTFYLRTEGRNTNIVTDLQVFVQAAPSRGSDDWFNGEVRNAFSKTSPDTGSKGSGNTPADGTDISLKNSASQGDEPVPSDRRNFNLKMYEVNKGDRIIAPEYAYTDGRFTYLHFPAGMTDRPAVFRIVDGVEGRVNTRVTGRHSEVMVVEGLGDLILRSGTRSVCIVQVDRKDRPAGHSN